MKKHIFYFGAMMLTFALTACKGDDIADVTKTTGVEIEQKEASIVVTQSIELKATVYPIDAENQSIIWESSDPAIADVSTTGTVTGVAAGDVTVTATTEDGMYKASCEVTVEAMTLTTTDSLPLHSISLEVGDEDKFVVTTNVQQVVTDASVVWESGDTSVATVTDGVIKGISEGMTIITAKIGANTATVLVSVIPVPTIQRCEEPAEGWFEGLGEISFKTDKTWTVGAQEWSDVVMAANARTDDKIDGDTTTFFQGWHQWCEDPDHAYAHPTFYCDARVNLSREYGDLFSWCTVAMYRKQLCPDGWRVPSSNDFKVLNIALGGHDVGPGEVYEDQTGVIDRYIEDWGTDFGTQCNDEGYIAPLDSVVWYWAINEYSDIDAFFIEINVGKGLVMPESYWRKNYGSQVRCVRDIE